MEKVLLVTGASRLNGIGLAICDKVLKEGLNYRVLMTCRNTVRGTPALRALQEKYPQQRKQIDMVQTDICQKNSVKGLTDYLTKRNMKIDVLVNNAGIMYLADEVRRDSKLLLARDVQNVNFSSTVALTETLKPFLNDNGKILNMSSAVGPMTYQSCNPKLRKRLNNPELTKEELFQIKDEYLAAVEKGTLKEEGFPYWKNMWELKEFGPSKLFLQYMCGVWGRDPEIGGRNIQVNSMAPGIVDTDMMKQMTPPGGKNKLTPEEGTKTTMFLINKPWGAVVEEQGKFLDENCKFWNPK